MTTSAEIRETLVAGGVAEDFADAVVATFGAMRDEAVAEAVAQAAEQNGHSAARLDQRLDEHADENDRQFRSMLDEITVQIAEGRKELVDFRVEYERRFGDFRTENERQFATLRGDLERQFAEQQKENERQFAKQREEFAEQRAENERQFAKQREEFAELKVQMAEWRADFERRTAVAVLGLAGLIVGAAAATIAAFAIFAGS